MAASVALPAWRPRTLTDRRNDISTVDLHSTPAGFAPTEIHTRKPGLVELIAQTGNTIRRLDLRVESLPPPLWLEPTLKNCGHLLLLPSGWDGENAPTVEGVAIQSAFDALSLFMTETSSTPQWTPTQNGGVQLDWHENGVDLEIAFDTTDAEGNLVFCDHRDGANWDGPVSQHLQGLRSLFAERLNAPAGR